MTPSGTPSSSAPTASGATCQADDGVELAAGEPDGAEHGEVAAIGPGPHPARVHHDGEQDAEAGEAGGPQVRHGGVELQQLGRLRVGEPAGGDPGGVVEAVGEVGDHGGRVGAVRHAHHRELGAVVGSAAHLHVGVSATSAPMPRRGVSVPVWLTGGNVATPTTRSSTGGFSGWSLLARRGEELHRHQVAELRVDALERVLAEHDLVVGETGSAAQQRGGDLAADGGGRQPRHREAVDEVGAGDEGRGGDDVVASLRRPAPGRRWTGRRRR